MQMGHAQAQTPSMFAPGPNMGGGVPGDFTQASQFAVLQALLGQNMGGMPFGFPNHAVNPFAGMMPGLMPDQSGAGMCDVQMGAQGGAEAMAAQMGHMGAPFYPPSAPWPAAPTMPPPAPPPAAEAALAAAPAEDAGVADVGGTSEGAEAAASDPDANGKPEIHEQNDPAEDARGDSNEKEPANDALRAEGAAIPALA